ncbi:YgaP family membrane protein [Bacillus infantis]|uniref:YgaP family membrane protein n=1 Tax=Bacillus infantis TaxID=324767 RepID=UPI003CF7AB50
MKIKQNIGILNALIRITIGLTVLSWSTAKLVKMPWRDSYLVMAMLGAMKVAEGIVRYCPVTAMLDRGQDMMNESSSRKDHSEQKHKEPHAGGDKQDLNDQDLAMLEKTLMQNNTLK